MEKLRVRGTAPDLRRLNKIYNLGEDGMASVRRIAEKVKTHQNGPESQPESAGKLIEWEAEAETVER